MSFDWYDNTPPSNDEFGKKVTIDPECEEVDSLKSAGILPHQIIARFSHEDTHGEMFFKAKSKRYQVYWMRRDEWYYLVDKELDE